MTSASSDDRPYLTEEGRRLLEERIRDREKMLEELRASLEESGPSTDNAESHHRLQEEVDRLRAVLDASGTVEEEVPDDPTTVELGDRVTIRLDDGAEETYIVVHAAEALVHEERISIASPLGQALLGRHVGETVEVDVPAGGYRATIISASR
jgi:transcription elongation factor GreA